MPFAYDAALKTLSGLLKAAEPGWPLVWAQQGVVRPPPPFWGLRFGDLVPVGTKDYVTPYAFDATKVGSELSRTVLGVRVLHVSVQAYSPTKLGDQDPALTAMALFAMQLQMEANVNALADVGLGLGSVGSIQNISALLDNDWESRTNLDLTFLLTDDAPESVGYIATVVGPSGTVTS